MGGGMAWKLAAILRIDPDTIVLNKKDGHTVIRQQAEFYPRGAVVAAVLDRVLNQVLPDLEKTRTVTEQHQVRIRLLQVDISFADDAGQGVYHLGRQLLERYPGGNSTGCSTKKM